MNALKNIFIMILNVFVVFSFVACDDRSKKQENVYEFEKGISVCEMGALHYLNCDYASKGYHSFYRLKNGALVGELGSMMYLINQKGNRLSVGFHKIVPNEDGNGYTARVGAMVVRLDKEGKPISDQDKALVSELEKIFQSYVSDL